MPAMNENIQIFLEQFLYVMSHLVPRDFNQVLLFFFCKYEIQKDENRRCALKIWKYNI